MSPDSLQAPDDPEAAAIKAQEAALVRAAVAKAFGREPLADIAAARRTAGS